MTVRDLPSPAERVGRTPRVDPAAAATLRRHLWRWGVLVLAVAYLAHRAIGAVLDRVGHAGAPLDDAYIHFQYARAIAEGHPMRFQAGEPATSGATSLLWPAALAPFWLLGARGDGIVWAAWALSFLALGGLAWEADALTERLAGRSAAIGAAAMTLACGGLLWSAASGMEVVPFAWAIARASRRAIEWAEAPPAERTPRRAGEIAALAWVAALLRPEGAVTALFVAAALARFAGTPVGARRWVAPVVAAMAAVAPSAITWLVTGSLRSNTAVVKLLPGNPYYPAPALLDAVRANIALFAGTLLNGRVWSSEFLPDGGAPIAWAGLVAVAWLGSRTRLHWRAAGVLLIAATMLAPCAYGTFLWNRLRYLWPFVTGWLVGLACLARLAGDLMGRLRAPGRVATPLLCGVFVGILAARLDWVIADVAQSASGIDRQQVALGRWAKESLPAGARVGVNDTGAIAYFGDRKTFDVVGLTTPGEGRYWIAGAGSRLEHYERLGATAPERLPTHFIVYPEWMAIDAVLGTPLHEATVTDATILGGKTMRAYVADWSLLGSGERPWTPSEGAIVDTLDVADLESEAEHGYELLGAREGEEVAREGASPAGDTVIDGGRTRRTRESFVAHLRAGVAALGIVRLEARPGTPIAVFTEREPLGRVALEAREGRASDWVEGTFRIPPDAAAADTPIELRPEAGAISTFHYWFVQ